MKNYGNVCKALLTDSTYGINKATVSLKTIMETITMKRKFLVV